MQIADVGESKLYSRYRGHFSFLLRRLIRCRADQVESERLNDSGSRVGDRGDTGRVGSQTP